MIENTLFLVKPDGVQRGLIGEIIKRLEQTGLQVIGLKLIQMTRDMAEEHYSEHKNKSFYASLIDYITSSPVIAVAFQGPSAIGIVRRTMGSTNPLEAESGTIRGDLSIEVGRNLVHGSANADDAKRELNLFFAEEELIQYERSLQSWLTE